MTSFITTTEAGQRMRLTREQVLRLIARGRIGALYVAGRWAVDSTTVDAYVAKHSQPQSTSQDDRP